MVITKERSDFLRDWLQKHLSFVSYMGERNTVSLMIQTLIGYLKVQIIGKKSLRNITLSMLVLENGMTHSYERQWTREGMSLPQDEDTLINHILNEVSMFGPQPK